VAANHQLPQRITLALAAYLKIYAGQADFAPQDTPETLAEFKRLKGEADYLGAALADQALWGEDLTQYAGLKALLQKDWELLTDAGARAAVQAINAEEGGNRE
jgi:tagaturonate reductase